MHLKPSQEATGYIERVGDRSGLRVKVEQRRAKIEG